MENIITDAKQEENNESFNICGDDIGCLIEGETLGTEAATAYLEESAIIASLPHPPITNSPTIPLQASSIPTSVPITSNNATEDEQTEDGKEVPQLPPSGSKGDPHCEYSSSVILVMICENPS